MAWYDIPKVKIQYVQDERARNTRVLLSSRDFEKLVEQMEDFLDIESVEKAEKVKNPKLYTHEEIKALIKAKKR